MLIHTDLLVHYIVEILDRDCLIATHILLLERVKEGALILDNELLEGLEQILHLLEFLRVDVIGSVAL